MTPNASPTTLFFIAGEASGDLHTANLVQELKKIRPTIRFCGLGGPRMREAGVEILFELTKLAAVGFVDVMRKYHKFHKVFHNTLEEVKKIRPAAVVLTDFPGFNLRFAQQIKKCGIPVIYYISPQVWAWKKDRIHTIPKVVDKMLVILPFEKNIYVDPAMQVDFVGHPLVDEVKPSADKDVLKKEFGLAPDQKVITLLPGSRKGEVTKILPIMAQTAELLSAKIPDCTFLIAKTACLQEHLYTTVLKRHSFKHTIIEGRSYDCFSVSDFALVKSGTSTLEATILGIPYVLIYHVSSLTYLIGRCFVTIPFLGIANIIAGRKIIEEFIQHAAEPAKIASYVHDVLRDENKIQTIKRDLRSVTDMITTPNASANAARSVIAFLDEK
ncbi:MAG: lipid-A-disaccharide synthase [Candidatus Omnitrophica bacterium]|nr:lipid-A-disaccharide synthase [Candidatus Omnitrophota bacterium]